MKERVGTLKDMADWMLKEIEKLTPREKAKTRVLLRRRFLRPKPNPARWVN